MAFNNRCWARAQTGQALELALADCNQALQLLPNRASFLDTRALVNFRLGRFDKAIADASAALATEPTYESSLYVRGAARRRLGDRAGGDADIAAAKMISQTVAAEYAGYGVAP
jgi:tetratricopeptide (TPR) repeat protein